MKKKNAGLCEQSHRPFLFCSMKSTHRIVVAVAPLRHDAADRSEQVNQMLYDEGLLLLDRQEKWSLVRSCADGYEGWIDNKQFAAIPEGFVASQRLVVHQRSTAIANSVAEMHIPHGCVLQLDAWGKTADGYFGDNGDTGPTKRTSIESLLECGRMYLNTPYLWGGRSIWGIDCSGLMQQIFRVHGVEIPRDSGPQSQLGEAIHLIGEARAGDLAFFDNEEGKIIHVGLMIGPDRILHASGHVRIDRIDHFGIYNQQQQRYTHKLRIIRRIL